MLSFLTRATLERISGVIGLTATNEAAYSIVALGILTTGIFLAFVNIC